MIKELLVYSGKLVRDDEEIVLISIFQTYFEIQVDSKVQQLYKFQDKQCSIEWTVKNHEVTSMNLIDQIGSFKFMSLKGTLNTLKSQLDGKVPYKNFLSLYFPIKLIKSIHEGQILLVKNILTGQLEIAKSLALDRNKLDKRASENELDISLLFSINPHQNLINLTSFFIENDQIVLVFPNCQVTSLHKYLNDIKQPLGESIAKSIMKKLLKAIQHMHQSKIMHRDLKMDNILLLLAKDPKSIKIIDYGYATYVDEQQELFSKCGTPGYIAPEIFEACEYNELCDVYSLGTVFHYLLSGESIFKDNSSSKLLIMNEKNQTVINGNKIKNPHAIDLLEKMTSTQFNRPTVQECLDHQFFKSHKIENKMKSLPELSMRSPFNK